MDRPRQRSTARGIQGMTASVRPVLRRCRVCEWQEQVLEMEGLDPDCPWCHAPTFATPVATAGPSSSDDGTGKNPHAAALGRLGGIKGGPARAETLSAKRRQEIASK